MFANPIFLLFVAAVVATLVQRVARSLFDTHRIGDAELQNTISVVAYVGAGESIVPYLALLRACRWPSRVRLSLFKALAPDEAADPAATAPNVRVSYRYGTSFDPAQERARLLEHVHTKFVLLLAQPVDAAAGGWDETLIEALARCEGAAHPVLTCMPPRTRDGNGTFLCVREDSRLVRRRYAYNPNVPLPSLFWSAGMSFSHTETLLPAAVAGDDLACTQQLWTRGANFFSPPLAVFVALAKPAVAPKKRPTVASTAKNAVRTQREWQTFVGRKANGQWNRRALVGVTPDASHQERYSKYGDEIMLHGM